MPILRSTIGALLAITALPAFCASRYVDGTNGNDTNDGLTLATAWATIQKSFDSAQPGDRDRKSVV